VSGVNSRDTPTQLTTSTSSQAYQRPANDKVALLFDGSLLVVDYDGTNGHAYQVTSPTGDPNTTSLQTFAEDNLSLAVSNSSTTSDVWVLSGDDLTGTVIHIQHASYDGSSWTWDASTQVATPIATHTNDVSVCWTGTWLMAFWWDGAGETSNDQIAYSWTTTKDGTSGWSPAAKFDPSGTSTTIWQPCVRHSAKLGATVLVYGGNSRTFYSILKDSAADPSRANWTTTATVDPGFDDTFAEFGGPQVVINESDGKIHATRSVCDSGGPTWFGVTYWLGTPDAAPMVTPSITWSPRLIVDSDGSATSPTDIAVACDPTNLVWVFWTDNPTDSNLKYATISSPYTSASSSTILTPGASQPRYPHVPTNAALPGYIPLVYQAGTASPFGLWLDSSLSPPSST
jgi:hypothetical protein